MGLKDSWKKVGGDFASLGKDLGKSIVKTVRKGAEKASDWAERDDQRIADEAAENTTVETPEEEK